MTIPPRAEEWIATKVPALESTFSKVAASLVTLVVPIFLTLSGLSLANKILSNVLWLSVIWNLLLLARGCSHRIRQRQQEADLAKTPDLPELTPFDLSMLIYLVAQNAGCGVDRMAAYCGKASYEVSRSMDKLLAWGLVDNTRDFTASGAEYRANAEGRDRCINPSKK